MSLERDDDERVWPGGSACPGCGETLAYRHVTRALGRNTAVVTSAGCGSVVTGYHPTTASKLPFFHCSFGTAAATAAGLKAGLEMVGKAKTTVLAWAGDGGTFDIGFQSLSGAAERNDDILYVCYDNEAYMNTGVQRSSATPLGSWTTTTPGPGGEGHPKKNIAAILAAHAIPYLATASVSHTEDLVAKVRTAREIRGFRFLHVIVPCPTGWLYPARQTIALGRLAVATRIFPLFEVFEGRQYRLSPMEEQVPVREYLSRQGRFRNLSEEDIRRVQESVDRAWEELRSLAAPGRQGRP